MEYEITAPKFFYDLKAIPAFKHAIIAGGYLRDQVYGIKPKDLDIFMPIQYDRTFQAQVLAAYPNAVYDADQYGRSDFQKFHLEEDGMTIEIMGVHTLTEKFGNNLIETFPWANQQIFFDGKKLFTSTRFDEDIKHGSMTLVNCTGIGRLPAMMTKFNSVSSRYPGLQFRSDYLLTRRNGDDWL